MRHLETQELWIQQAIKEKKLTVHKIPGTENSSDILTKYVPKAVLEKHLPACGIVDEGNSNDGKSSVSAIRATCANKRVKYGNEQWWKPSLLKAATLATTFSAAAKATTDSCSATTAATVYLDRTPTTISFTMQYDYVSMILLLLALVGIVQIIRWLIWILNGSCIKDWLRREAESENNYTQTTEPDVNGMFESHYTEYGTVYHTDKQCNYLLQGRIEKVKTRKGCNSCVRLKWSVRDNFVSGNG
jgi:hypothetical protein